VHRHQRVQARPPPAPHEHLLVLERLEVGVGQLLVTVNTATAPECLPRLPDLLGVVVADEPVEAAGRTVADPSWVVAPDVAPASDVATFVTVVPEAEPVPEVAPVLDVAPAPAAGSVPAVPADEPVAPEAVPA
jgi:hypothetical protein